MNGNEKTSLSAFFTRSKTFRFDRSSAATRHLSTARGVSTTNQMRVLMLSKALLVGAYQTKLEAIARHPDVDLLAIVPPSWDDPRGPVALERRPVATR